jgi:glycosyltransferase involved in cell wall biosynthesis
MYRRYDVFVLPTRPGEGIPRVLTEAMAAGMPVVTTDVAGIGSLITSGVNGVLADGTADAFADAVTRLIQDPGLRRRVIAGGYDTVRGLTLEKQAERLMQVVSESLAVPVTSMAPTSAA